MQLFGHRCSATVAKCLFHPFRCIIFIQSVNFHTHVCDALCLVWFYHWCYESPANNLHILFRVTGEFPTQRPVPRSFDVSLIWAWINGWINNREVGDLRRPLAHYYVTVMLVADHVNILFVIPSCISCNRSVMLIIALRNYVHWCTFSSQVVLNLYLDQFIGESLTYRGLILPTKTTSGLGMDKWLQPRKIIGCNHSPIPYLFRQFNQMKIYKFRFRFKWSLFPKT